MTNTRRWPPGPWIEPIRVAGSNQWDFKKVCVKCGLLKSIWYFRNQRQIHNGIGEPLCKECGDVAYQMQQMDRLVNE